MQTASNWMGRIRLFPLLFQNGCYQSSRFPTAGQGKRRLWERDWKKTQLNAAHAQLLKKLRPIAFAETCRFLTIQSLEFQEIWQENCSETT